MGPIVWLIAAAVFALVELLTLDFSLLMLAVAALAAAGVATADISLWAEIATFAITAFVTLFALRPMLKKRFRSFGDDHRFTHKQLEGRSATVVNSIAADNGATGMVNIGGNFWTAQAAHPGVELLEGETVEVLEIKGTTAVVWKGI